MSSTSSVFPFQAGGVGDDQSCLLLSYLTDALVIDALAIHVSDASGETVPGSEVFRLHTLFF